MQKQRKHRGEREVWSWRLLMCPIGAAARAVLQQTVVVVVKSTNTQANTPTSGSV